MMKIPANGTRVVLNTDTDPYELERRGDEGTVVNALEGDVQVEWDSGHASWWSVIDIEEVPVAPVSGTEERS